MLIPKTTMLGYITDGLFETVRLFSLCSLTVLTG
jgi:hypothetical protein